MENVTVKYVIHYVDMRKKRHSKTYGDLYIADVTLDGLKEMFMQKFRANNNRFSDSGRAYGAMYTGADLHEFVNSNFYIERVETRKRRIEDRELKIRHCDERCE